MRPALLFGLSMGALLGEASEARAVAGRAPAGLWEEVYRMTADSGPEAAWRRAVGGRGVSFGDDGFPKALAGREGMLTAPRLAVATVGTMAVAATATGFATTGHHAPATGTGSASASSLSAVVPSAPSSNVTAAGASQGVGGHAKSVVIRPGRPAARVTPSSLPTSGGSSVTVASGSTAASRTASSAGRTGAATATSGSSSSSASGASGASGSSSGGSSSSAPSASPSPSASSSPSAQPSSSASAGTLSVSTSEITLAAGRSGSFTLTADGGPVNWSISVPSGLLGSVSLSQTSGSLAAGQSVTIRVGVSGLATLDSALTISPGNETLTVLLGLGL